jgi:hypothetical protein
MEKEMDPRAPADRPVDLDMERSDSGVRDLGNGDGTDGGRSRPRAPVGIVERSRAIVELEARRSREESQPDSDDASYKL